MANISAKCLHVSFFITFVLKIKLRMQYFDMIYTLHRPTYSFVYKSLHGLAPKYLAELCVPVADVAGRRQLRSASRGLLNFPRYNMSNYGRRAFCFAGPYVWNSLPEHIRESTSIAVFKRSLKTFLLQKISHLAH